MSQGPESVILIDDDVELCTMLHTYLSRHGWSVSVAHGGESGIQLALAQPADLIVLDVMLPDIDGFEVLRRLHRVSEVRVMLLTARGEDIDRIVGLEMGADDYLGKPFNPRELLARMRAILRRTSPRLPQAKLMTEATGGFAVDEAKRLISFEGSILPLTDIEYALLARLLHQAEQVIEREELFVHIFGRSSRPFDRSLDMHISRLRRKLEVLDEFTGEIKTIRSNGYILILSAGVGKKRGGQGA